jgi:osmotically-inducible protein OsmY
MKYTKFAFLFLTLMMTSGCAPVLIGSGAAVVGGAMVSEKGISGTISDSQIATHVKVKLYQFDPELYQRVNVTVNDGEVMLTGAVPKNEWHLEAVRLAWEPAGVKRVIDNIGSSEGASFGTFAKDTWITTQLKSRLLVDAEVQSINYSIKTVSGNVYLMGIAQNQKELDHVIEVARNMDGVNKVVSYVKLKDAR